MSTVLWHYLLLMFVHVHAEEEVDGFAFKTLTDDELKEIGFGLESRKNIRNIISVQVQHCM